MFLKILVPQFLQCMVHVDVKNHGYIHVLLRTLFIELQSEPSYIEWGVLQLWVSAIGYIGRSHIYRLPCDDLLHTRDVNVHFLSMAQWYLSLLRPEKRKQPWFIHMYTHIVIYIHVHVHACAQWNPSSVPRYQHYATWRGGNATVMAFNNLITSATSNSYFLILEWQGSSCVVRESSTWMLWEKHPSNSCTTTVIGPCSKQEDTLYKLFTSGSRIFNKFTWTRPSQSRSAETINLIETNFFH